MRIVTSHEMMEIEKLCSSAKLLSEDQMAENAGYLAAAEINRTEPIFSTLILCGPGNNGADGMITAFYLSTEFGQEVEVVLAADPDKLRPLGRKAYRRLAETDVRIFTPGGKQYERRLNEIGVGETVVDALLGSGQKGPPRGEVAKIMDAVGGHPGVIVLDVPTGVDSDTGEILGAHPVPFATLCIGLPKRYLFTGEGRKYAANWKLIPIGIPDAISDGLSDSLVGHEIDSLLPVRDVTSHKRSSVVLSIAGSLQYPGAAALVASAAYRMGAGMVVAAGPIEGLEAVRGHIIEAPLAIVSGKNGSITGDAREVLEPWLRQAHSVVLGPGIGRSSDAGNAVQTLLDHDDESTWVIDGDALFHIAERSLNVKKSRAILTPHSGEAARLLQVSPEEVDADRFGAVAELADKFGQVVVLKGFHPLVAAPNAPVDVIATGTPLLATAGTGDILSGMIASLAAQHLSPRNAATIGAGVHGYLAEVNTVRLGGHTYGVLASELAQEIPVIISLLHSGGLYPKCLELLAPNHEEDFIDEDDD